VALSFHQQEHSGSITLPYFPYPTVQWFQQLARPLPLPPLNIHHHAQGDPGANIIATNNINVLQDTIALEKTFTI
jgi:hypothetical protein